MTRVLIVDDKEENLYYLQTLISNDGCEVESARHGAEALVKARRSPPDIVISDLLMPVMDGYTLLRHWKADARLKQVPFIVYTATYTEAEDEQLALKLGADAFILKPAEPEDFLARLRQVKANASAAVPEAPHQPVGDESGTLKQYSETLIRKLEEKTLELEATNRSLQRAEREASERAAVLHALFESVPDVVTHLDLEGRVQLINRPTPGGDGQTSHGRFWLTAGSPDQQALMKNAFETVVSSGVPTSFETQMSGANGVPTVLWNTISPVVRDDKITGAVVVARDISERKQTEAQLIVSDRMASVGTLAAGVAHEINNPLAAVVANLALAAQDLEALAKLYPVSKDLLDELSDAREATERVRLIVRDLKIFSRNEETTNGPVNVERVLESTLRMAWNELRHRARLVKVFDAVPQVNANESRLGQVLLNLVVNAAQAIPEGNYQRNEIRVTTKVDPTGRHVVISIADTGSGIAPEIKQRLFTPFFTTKPVGMGTGLGLSICRRIVTELGGKIDFSSEVGKGSTFRVSLPIADVRPEIEVPAPARNARLGARRGSVLVVDDDVMLTHSVQRILTAEHDVQAIDSADKAIDLFGTGARFDVVLCDVMMPQVTGLDFYAKLVEIDPKQAARVVFMTGGAFTPTARAFLDGASNRRIEKPFDIQELRLLINGLVV